MDDLAAVALDIERWNSRLEKRSSSIHSTAAVARSNPCQWSSYFVESSNSAFAADDFGLCGLVTEAAPERASFTQKKNRELLKLANSFQIVNDLDQPSHSHRVDWVAVARNLSTESIVYSARDCYIHYNNVVSKQINKGAWGVEEDRKLLASAQVHEVSALNYCFSLCYYSYII